MTTGEAKRISEQVLKDPKLKRAQELLILGINRDHPGYGDDAILIDRKTGVWKPISGEFREGTRSSPDQLYRAACDEYRANGWSREEDRDETEDALCGHSGAKPAGNVVAVSNVIVPKKARSLASGTKFTISYRCDDGSQEDTEEEWKSDSYGFDMTEIPVRLSFHVNKNLDGIVLDEDFFDFPLICWNTGSLPVKADGKKIPAGAYLILWPSDPKRRERWKYYADMMSVPIWDSEAEIGRNEQRLLARGCPAGDARPLAAYFWRSLANRVEDYEPADHAFWMNEVRREGTPG